MVGNLGLSRIPWESRIEIESDDEVVASGPSLKYWAGLESSADFQIPAPSVCAFIDRLLIFKLGIHRTENRPGVLGFSQGTNASAMIQRFSLTRREEFTVSDHPRIA